MGITLDYPTCLSHLLAAKLYGIGISAKSFISTALPVTLFLYHKLDYLFCVVWLQVEDLVNKIEAVVKELNKLKHENRNPRPGSVIYIALSLMTLMNTTILLSRIYLILLIGHTSQ